MLGDLPEAFIEDLRRYLNVKILENLHKFCLADDLHMVEKLFECWIFLQVDLLLLSVKVKD